MWRDQSWTALKPGDKVEIVAPGFRCTDEELRGAVRFLEKLKFEPVLPKKIFGKHLLCSNSDEFRLNHLVQSLKSQESKAVWCVRGAYGVMRLLPKMRSLAAPKSVKLVIGFSDVTALHLFLGQKWGWPSLHGPLLDRMGQGKVTPQVKKELLDVIFGRRTECEYKGLVPLNKEAKLKKEWKGKCTGTNLCMVNASLATFWQVETRKKILVFEDIDERGYKVDRMLQQLAQAGLLAQATGIVFAEFTSGRESSGKTLVPQVQKQFAEAMNIPVFRGLATGHGKVQRVVPLNTPSVLRGGDRGVLTCQAGSQ